MLAADNKLITSKNHIVVRHRATPCVISSEALNVHFFDILSRMKSKNER